jgi:tetratricopeptide (TPR) repeat protein
LEEALEAYSRVSKLSPDDPLALERSADVLERMGRLEEAGKQYIAVAEIHLSQRNVERAITNWERATSLLPNEVTVRSRLAVAYERTAQNKQAIREYVALAATFQRLNDLSKATQALQRALKIDPTNDKIRNNLAALRAGSPVDLPDAPDPVQVKKEGFEAFTSTTTGEVLALSPTAQAAEKAMGTLAELLFEGDLSAGTQAEVAQAIEQQRSGDSAAAIASYQKAMKDGLKHPAAWLNLGLVYDKVGDAEAAVDALQHVTDEPDYGVAANLVLGRTRLKLEEWGAAAQHLVNALRYADLTVAPGEEAQTNVAYDAALNELQDQDNEKLRGLSQALVEMLDTNDWQRRLIDMRDRLESGETSGLIQMLLEPGAGKVASVLENINTYVSRGLLLLAMEEAHYAVELSPWYLPVHVRMAEVLVEEGRFLNAAAKYNMIANAYMARGEQKRAADMYAAVLKIDSMDIPARRRVIEMFMEQERAADALEHYEELAEAYMLMADAENARKVFQEAIALGQQTGTEPERLAQLFHQIGDLDVQRLDWRQALRSYEQIVELTPGDEKASLEIVDLHFRLGDGTKAVERLDAYLGYCIQNNKVDRIVPVLEEQVRTRPDEIALRQRLARVYQEQKRLPEAIAQMDALGELLLEAGRQQEAVAMIRQIVDLNPPDVYSYRQLLQQIEGTDDP